MRKIISILLAVALAFSWSSFAFAEGEPSVKADAKTQAYTELKKASGGSLSCFMDDGQFFLSGKLSAAQTPGVSAAAKFLDTYKALFGIKSVDLELRASEPEKDGTGDTFVRFTQLINDVEVFGSLVNVHFDKDGTIVSVNGRVLQDKRITNLGSQRITNSAAVGIAQKQYTYEKLRDNLQPTKKMVITKDGKNYITYRVNIAYEQPTISNYNVFVEATSGKVVLTEDKIRYSGAETGTGTDVQGNVQTLDLTHYDDIDGEGTPGYGMLNTVNPGSEEIVTVAFNSPYDEFAYLVTSPTNQFNEEVHKASVSAHYYADVVVDFYKDVFDRNSLDDKYMPIVSFTHYGDKYNNAFWSGYQMVYGDGDGTQFTYLSGDLDVVGHEMTHGVIDYTAMLYYANESGALNESIADVFGVMIETYDKYDVATGGDWTFSAADWVIGDEIYTPSIDGDALRSLADPTLYGDPAHMSDYHYLPNTDAGDWGGVHTNSGIPNKAAFLVAQELGMEKTARIYYRALSEYMYEYTTFAEAMECLIMAAEDLYGWYSDEAIAVRNAYKSVGVELPIFDPYEPNDYPDCASLLWPFEDVKAYVTSLNDNDYYILYADHPCTYTVSLSDIPENCNYNLSLLDMYEEEVGSSTQAGNTSENISMPLDPGIYYILVTPVNEGVGFSKKDPYTLRLEQSTLAAPAVTAASASYNSIKLKWTGGFGATAFEVYRATASTGTYTKIATLNESSFSDYPYSYTNTGLATNVAYYYKIKAIRTSPSLGTYSSVVSARAVPSASTTFNVASASYSSIKASWSAVSGASGYELYRSTSSSGTYSRVYAGTALAYTNTSLKTGSAYYYKVRAYRTVGSTKVYGPFTAAKYARPTLGVPTSVRAARASATSIKVTWGGVTGASGYELWRSTSSTGTYALVKTTTSRYYTNTGLSTGKYYYYKVRAYRMVGSSKVYSAYSAYSAAKP